MIDINKKYRTVQGDQVIIHTTSGQGDKPIVGQLNVTLSGIWSAMSWREDGTVIQGRQSCLNLVEVDLYEGWESGDAVLMTHRSIKAKRAFIYRGNGKFGLSTHTTEPWSLDEVWTDLVNLTKQLREVSR